MADSITTRSDAEAAGWRVVHEGVDPNAEDSTGNSEMWRAEKYLNEHGRAGVFIEAWAVSEEKLYEAIGFREQQFSVSEEGDVFLPKPGEEADTSDESTFERVSAYKVAGVAQNDVLTVRSDPADPESEPVQQVIRGGVEVDPAEAEVTPESLANETVVQPEAGQATDAPDSVQQEAVPDSEAASSDAVSTNSTDEFPKDNVSQPEITGKDAPAVEAPRPENAGQGETPASPPQAPQPIDPAFKQDTEVTGPAQPAPASGQDQEADSFA